MIEVNTMANMSDQTTKWVLSYTVDAAGTKTFTLPTKDKFVDKNIEANITTPAGALGAGATSASVTDVENILTEVVSQPSSGEYITLSAQGGATVTTGGFLAQGTSAPGSSVTKYYTIQNAAFTTNGGSVVASQKGYVPAGVTVATISNGAQTITGGGLSSGAKSSSITSNGYFDGSSYDSSDKVTLETTETQGYYKITSSGSATVNVAAVTKQVTTAGYFAADAEPVQAIAADSITVATPDHSYYILKSTLSSNSITPSTSPQSVTVSAGYYPTNRTIVVSAMTGVTPTTSLTGVGLSTYFNQGTSADKDITITPLYSTDAGFVNAATNENAGGVEYYKVKQSTMTLGTTSTSGGVASRGTASWTTGWLTANSISAAAFKNTGTSGKSYVDISLTNDAPILVSGDYLYIDAGYTDDLKISLAKLVPNGSDVKGHSEYILAGHSAYDDDGVLVAGSIPTYDGSYALTP
jgi:hypothetical protein